MEPLEIESQFIHHTLYKTSKHCCLILQSHQGTHFTGEWITFTGVSVLQSHFIICSLSAVMSVYIGIQSTTGWQSTVILFQLVHESLILPILPTMCGRVE